MYFNATDCTRLSMFLRYFLNATPVVFNMLVKLESYRGREKTSIARSCSPSLRVYIKSVDYPISTRSSYSITVASHRPLILRRTTLCEIHSSRRERRERESAIIRGQRNERKRLFGEVSEVRSKVRQRR